MADLLEISTRWWNDRDRAGHRGADDAELVAPGVGGQGRPGLLDR